MRLKPVPRDLLGKMVRLRLWQKRRKVCMWTAGTLREDKDGQLVCGDPIHGGSFNPKWAVVLPPEPYCLPTIEIIK